MIPRTIFSSEHELFRDTVRKFIEREIAPYHAQWEHDGIVPRELWLKAGEAAIFSFRASSSGLVIASSIVVAGAPGKTVTRRASWVGKVGSSCRGSF